jgi:arabinofuranan 3-O-arabinosyltransferase
MQRGRRWLATGLRPAPTISAVLILLAFVQSPGRVGFDTKLDLVLDPVRFMQRALHLWTPDSGFGELQNQAYGYLFPIGPFFAAGALSGLPMWVVQAAWTALLLVGAFVGALRLARALGVGTEATRLVAAAAYALSPRMITVLGPISAEAVPIALLPWCLLPLVLGGRGEMPARRAAGLSGLAVLAMGGANAALTLAVLPVPALWLLTRPRGVRLRLGAWWALAVTLATLWWTIPLLLLGRYGAPFLDYIESAANTTAPVSLTQALRGTSDWIAFLVPGGEPWWPAGWTLIDNPALIVATGALAAVGIAGLARRDLPERGFLLLAAVTGLVLLTLGHTGSLAAPFADGWQGLLDGPLAPLRNVHKFEPLLRLPLLLAAAHLLSRVRMPARAAVVTVSAVLVAVTAAPLALQQLRPEPTWRAVPTWWRSAADWVADHADVQRTLLVPGSGFGRYHWGRTIDEPMQGLADSPWAVRSQVPLGSEGNTRLLDAVNEVLASGAGSTGLADLLARSGVRYLLVRNDLDWVAAGTPRPAVVHNALQRSPGLVRAASFGPTVGGGARDPLAVYGYDLDPGYPALEVYEVDRTVQTVSAVSVDDAAIVTGGPESVLHLLESRLLGVNQPTVLAGERSPLVGGRWLVTDGLRRVERNFGRLYGATSPVLTADERPRLHRPAHDLLPFPAAGHQTVARYVGIRAVTASSAGSDADTLGPSQPQFQPYAAMDGDPATMWRSSALGGPVGQWLQVDLLGPTSVETVDVRLAQHIFVGPRITRVAVTTERGTRDQEVLPGEVNQSLLAVPGETRWVRIRVIAADREPAGGFAGIRELSIPGVSAGRTLVVPETDTDSLPAGAAGAPGGYELAADAPRSACVIVALDVRCDPTMASEPAEAGGIDRVIPVPEDATYAARGTVLPRSAAAIQRLLDPVGSGVRVHASSALVGTPAVAGGNAMDGNPATSWVADLVDPDPTLTLTWGGRRRLDQIGIVSADHPASARPLRLRLVTPTEQREVEVSAGGPVRFAPLVTDRVEVHVIRSAPVRNLDPANGLRSAVPPGIAELRFPALADITYWPRPTARTGLPCGLGPYIDVDGRLIATRVGGRIRDLLESRPLSVVPCGRDARPFELTPGPHRIRLLATAEFVPYRLRLLRAGLEPQGPVEQRPTTVVRWDATARRVDVGPGPASLLVVAENANAGWRATLNGQRLRPTRVDGWQQAWIVPAGDGGTVDLVYTPDRLYRAALIGGAGAVALLVALVLWPPGPPAVARPAGRRRRGPAPADVVSAGLLLVLGGLVALAGLAVALALGRRRPGLLPWLAGGAAGLAAAVLLTGRLLGHGQQWAQYPAAQALCLLAVGAAVVASVRWPAVRPSDRSAVAAGRTAAVRNEVADVAPVPAVRRVGNRPDDARAGPG